MKNCRMNMELRNSGTQELRKKIHEQVMDLAWAP
jgi:hypothetical protein